MKHQVSDYQDIHTIICNLIKESHYNYEDIATQIGVSTHTVISYYYGRKKISIANMIKLIKFLSQGKEVVLTI